MTRPKPTVFVVDDDPAVRDSLCWLISSVNLPVQAFSSAREFLDAVDPQQPGCVIIDVRMPEMSGLQLQEALAAQSSNLAMITITAHSDVPMVVRAMKAGAREFIEKPFNDQEMLELIQKAMEKSVETVRHHEQRRGIQQRYDTLNGREHQVLDGIIAGHPNKTIAADLGLSQKTVEVHRAKVMKKMQAKSLAELVGMVTKLGLVKEIP